MSLLKWDCCSTDDTARLVIFCSSCYSIIAHVATLSPLVCSQCLLAYAYSSDGGRNHPSYPRRTISRTEGTRHLAATACINFSPYRNSSVRWASRKNYATSSSYEKVSSTEASEVSPAARTLSEPAVEAADCLGEDAVDMNEWPTTPVRSCSLQENVDHFLQYMLRSERIEI